MFDSRNPVLTSHYNPLTQTVINTNLNDHTEENEIFFEPEETRLDNENEEYFDIQDVNDDEEIELQDPAVFVDPINSLRESNDNTPPPSDGWLTWGFKGLAKLSAAVATALPTAMNSLVMASGRPIKEVGENWNAWWNAMSIFQKIFSIINTGASEFVNAKLNLDFFSQFWDRVKSNFKNCLNSPKDFFINNISIILGFAGGIAAGAIAFEAFEFLLYLAIAFSCFNFSVFFISRYLGVNKTLTRLFNRETINTQHVVIDKFKHLKEHYKQVLQDHLDEIANKLREQHAADTTRLTKEDFEVLFAKLAEKLTEIHLMNDDCFNAKTCSEYTKELAGTIFDITFASFIAAIAIPTFTKKKRIGIETLLKLIKGDNPLKDLPNEQKIPFGILGGLASAMLYGISALDFRSLLVDASAHLYAHPTDIPKFLFELTANIFATSGMFNVGAGIPGDDNEFNISMNPYSYWLFTLGSAAGGLVVNFAPPLKALIEEPDKASPTVDEIIKYFHNPALNTISKNTAEGLRVYSLYAQQKEQIDPNEAELHHLHRNPSVYFTAS